MNAGNDVRQQFRTIQRSPFTGCGLAQFEHHRQARCPAAVALRSAMTQAHRRERALDRVRGPQVNPLLGWEVVERQQRDPILLQAGHRLRVLRRVQFDEPIERPIRVGPRRRHPDLVEHRRIEQLILKEKPKCINNYKSYQKNTKC